MVLAVRELAQQRIPPAAAHREELQLVVEDVKLLAKFLQVILEARAPLASGNRESKKESEHDAERLWSMCTRVCSMRFVTSLSPKDPKALTTEPRSFPRRR